MCDYPECTHPNTHTSMCETHYRFACGWTRRRDAGRENRPLEVRLTSLVMEGRGNQPETLALAREVQRLHLIENDEPPALGGPLTDEGRQKHYEILA